MTTSILFSTTSTIFIFCSFLHLFSVEFSFDAFIYNVFPVPSSVSKYRVPLAVFQVFYARFLVFLTPNFPAQRRTISVIIFVCV